MLKKAIMLSLMVVAGVGLLISGAGAQAPTTITYQGRLTNATGNPITSVDSVSFRIYSDAGGTNQLWSEKLSSLALTDNGVFTVELGTSSALTAAVFTGAKRYLGIKVNNDAEMRPLQLLTSTPYAISAQNIPDGSVGTNKIGSGAVTGPKIGNGAVGAAQLATSAVDSSKILNGSIARPELATDVSRLVPIAYGVINSDGTIVFSSPGVTCSWDAVNMWYAINVAGYSYLSGLYWQTPVTITLRAGNYTYVYGIDASSSGLLVKFWDMSNVRSQPYWGFQFVIWGRL